jgi:hypothetical protein
MERPSTTTGFVSTVTTIFVVTVMSLLVWVYAESRTAKPVETQASGNLPAGSPMQTFELAAVPVVLLYGPEEARRFVISISESDRFQHGVTISGPPWLVGQVLPLSQAVRAYVEVTAESIAAVEEGRVLIQPVIRGVPSGLTVEGVKPVLVGIKPVE